MAETQTYATHRRFLPLYHFVVVPLLVINLIVRIVYAVRHAGARIVWWEVVFALTLLVFSVLARYMTLRVQDRVVALEESLRLTRCLPDDLRARVGELRTRQLIALRFCADEEAADLTRAILNGELRDTGEIKQRIKSWRPDVRPRA